MMFPYVAFVVIVSVLFGTPVEEVLVDKDRVVLGIASLQAGTLLLQTFWLPSFNPFYPLQQILYAVFRVTGQTDMAPLEKEKGKEEEKKADVVRSILSSLQMVVLPIAVAIVSAVAQYYVLKFYSASANS